jgi:hypothetical protein
MWQPRRKRHGNAAAVVAVVAAVAVEVALVVALVMAVVEVIVSLSERGVPLLIPRRLPTCP